MRKIVFMAALLAASAAARAEDMDWHTEAAQTAIHSGLATASDMCASFGFTRVKLQPGAVMRDRIAALLGSAAPGDELNRWVEAVKRWFVPHDPTIDPGSDALRLRCAGSCDKTFPPS